jgi:OOP family OmpA-OmpF porin
MADLRFEMASAELTPCARRSLDELTGYLAKHPHQAVLLEGHTDSVGSDKLNFNLSKRRAGAAHAYLVARGIESSRLQTEGVGESDPVAGNATAAGRRENRSVAIIFETR